LEKTKDESMKEEETEHLVEESGKFDICFLNNLIAEFDTFTDNEEQKINKKRKGKTTSRKLWT
jgi:hypothetical protein